MYTVIYNYLLKRINFLHPPKRMQSVLVIAEHNNEALTPITQSAITAAQKIGGPLTVLVAGTECSAAAKCLSAVKGLKKILLADDRAFNGFSAENLTSLILASQKQFAFTHILAGATIFGKELLPRVAAKLNVPAITDITDVKGPDVFVRPIYAGNAFMTLKVKGDVKVITVRQNNFSPCALEDNKDFNSKLAVLTRQLNLDKALSCKDNKCKVEEYARLKRAVEMLLKWQTIKDNKLPVELAPAGTYNLGLTTIIRHDVAYSTKTKLAEANTVICGGRGMGSAKNFKMLQDLAQKLNAAVGASKAAVQAGFASSSMHIGETGQTVAPNLYIAIGVSGKTQHFEGMKNSKTIVAINNDSQAPIFKIANYGIVGDLFKVIPELIAKLK